MISAFFQGISPVLPTLFILTAAVISLLIAWFTYRDLGTISSIKKWGLIVLRASALAILVLLLLNPYITNRFTITEMPVIAVYLDNSESLTVERGEYRGEDQYREIIQRFNQEKDDRFRYRYYLFADDVVDGNDVGLTGTATNINRVMEHILENENRYSASIFFSDGIVTRGRNPVFTAQNISTPLITVPVGDTTVVRDIAISDVDFSEPVYTNTRTLFTAEIQQQGFEGEESTVQFIENGELLESRSIEYTSSSGSHIVEFTREFNEAGFYEMEINVPPKEEEFTDRNNFQRFNIEVIDDRTRILSLAFEIHPDVRSIRRLIGSDMQNELIISTSLGDGRFAGVNPTEMDEDPDLIVLHGLPSPNDPLLNWLENRTESILYVATPGSFRHLGNNRVSRITNLELPVPQTLLDVHISRPDQLRTHPLLEISDVVFNRMPALQTFRGRYSIGTASEVLLTAEFQRTDTDIPLLIAEDTGNRRLSAVNAFGWFRYDQSRVTENRRLFQELFGNLVSWTATPPDSRTLVLEPRRSSYSENESVEMRAVLTNERGEPEPNALIELRFFNDEEIDRTFRMNHTQRGVYTASLGNYPQGLYRAEAVATLNNRVLGEAETRVNVSRSNLELVDTRRDDATLNQLAAITGGLFLSDHDFGKLHDFFDEQGIVDSREELITEVNYIYRSIGWFILVVLLLTGEWLLRRSVSLP
jgi:hypothetical protein